MLRKLFGSHLLLLGELRHTDPRNKFGMRVKAPSSSKVCCRRGSGMFVFSRQDCGFRLPSLRQAGGWRPVDGRYPFVRTKGTLDKGISDLIVFFIWVTPVQPASRCLFISWLDTIMVCTWEAYDSSLQMQRLHSRIDLDVDMQLWLWSLPVR